jgi:lipopolysaccharide export system protein LptA
MTPLPDARDRLPDGGKTMSRPSIRKLSARGLFGGLVAGTLATLAFGSVAGAQNIAGFNTNQPVSFDADRIELQDRQNRVVLSGSVVIRQGDLRLSADRTTIAYSDSGTLTIQRLDAIGNVVVNRGSEQASGSAGVYDFNRKLITLSGGVNLRRGTDRLSGGRLVIDLNTGLSSVDGAGSGRPDGTTGTSNGRVSGTFAVPQ